jgi:3-methyl-2-oxobutanoate hydroxymethyltransferase
LLFRALFGFSGAILMKVNVNTLQEMKAAGEKIAMITAYDFPTAKIVDAAGADVVLVGDSLGNVVLGYPNTIPVTMDDMVHHTSAVVRGVENAFVIFDMPFMSYQVSVEDALYNAGRAMKETGCECVKLEGGCDASIEAVAAITSAGIPVCGHLGLTPQSVNAFGGYRVQGKPLDQAKQIIEDAEFLQAAGACMVVLECMPWKLAKLITERLEIPTIGIGAGQYCDGQVLVFHDMMNFSGGKQAKFVKIFANANKLLTTGVKNYVSEVKKKTYPDQAHSYEMEEAVVKKLTKNGKSRGKV